VKSVSIPSRWFALHPATRLDAKFWIRVKQLVDERKINHNATAQIREVIAEVDKEMSHAHVL
jgi:hypothetical protein